jgi:hypothetical protein
MSNEYACRPRIKDGYKYKYSGGALEIYRANVMAGPAVTGPWKGVEGAPDRGAARRQGLGLSGPGGWAA